MVVALYSRIKPESFTSTGEEDAQDEIIVTWILLPVQIRLALHYNLKKKERVMLMLYKKCRSLFNE